MHRKTVALRCRLSIVGANCPAMLPAPIDCEHYEDFGLLSACCTKPRGPPSQPWGGEADGEVGIQPLAGEFETISREKATEKRVHIVKTDSKPVLYRLAISGSSKRRDVVRLDVKTSHGKVRRARENLARLSVPFKDNDLSWQNVE